MGFQSADLNEFARSLAKLPGVVGVWLLPTTDLDSTMWVLVRGFDTKAHERRMAVRHEVETFLSEHRPEIQDSGFLFDYRVLIEDPELGEAQIPEDAVQVAA